MAKNMDNLMLFTSVPLDTNVNETQKPFKSTLHPASDYALTFNWTYILWV